MLRSRSRTQKEHRSPHGNDHHPRAGGPAGPTGDGAPASELTVTAPRAGAYLVIDREGTQVGTVRGDYVIGFTARYYGLVRRFPDLDEAKAAILAEYRERLAESASGRQPGTPAL